MRLRRRSFSLFSLLAATPLRGRAAPIVDSEAAVSVLAAAAYELFPHTEIAREHYDDLANAFFGADEVRANRFAASLGGASFLDLSRDQRVAQLTSVQGSADFSALRMHLMIGLYSDLAVTRHFGYPGPSLAQGGYLERGFDDLRWLPEPGAAGGAKSQ